MRQDAGRVGVWGASGSGKSAYVKARWGQARRVLCLDPQDEYGGRRGWRRTTELDRVREWVAAGFADFRIAYVPRAGREPEELHRLATLAQRVQAGYRWGGPILTVIAEELSFAFTVSGGVAAAPAFASLCSRGRHVGIEVVGVSQRPAEVSTRFRGNTTETVAFAARTPRDARAVADELGGGQETRSAIAGLPPLEYLTRAQGGPLRRATVDPRRGRYDLRTQHLAH